MKRVVLLVGLLLNVCLLFSQNDVEVFKLTANHVEKFIKEFPEIVNEFEALGVRYYKDEGEFSLPESAEKLEKINAVCVNHGYKSYDELITQATAILIAYATIAAEESMSVSIAEIQASIEDIKKDESKTPYEKDLAIKQLNASLEIMNTYAGYMSNSANVAVAEQYKQQLDEILKDYVD